MKISYYILFLFLLISCNEDEKKIIVPSPLKENPTVDSSSSSDKNIKIESSKKIVDEPVKNVFENNKKQTTYKIKSISELWAKYKSAKILATKYISENNLDSIIVYLNIAADASYDLSRKDIATWQLNNIGYYSINEFKKKTGYDRKIQKLAVIQNLREKGLLLEATKSIFSEYFIILSKSADYLHKAKLLDSEFEKSDRTQIIERNLEFIDWVDKFISNGSLQNR